MSSAQSTFQHLTVERGFPTDRRAWIIRIVVVVVLLALVIGFSYVHVNGTYKPYFKCSYLFVDGVKLPSWVCMETVKDGAYAPELVKNTVELPRTTCIALQNYDVAGVHPFGWLPCPTQPLVTWPEITGPLWYLNGPLEWLRGITVRTILIFFVITSLVLTLIYNMIIKPVIQVIKRLVNPRLDHGEEWKKLLGTVRTWSLILAVFLLLFLFSVGQAGGLELPGFLKPLAEGLGWIKGGQ